MNPVRYRLLPSPLGALLLWGTGHGLAGLYLPTGRHACAPDPVWEQDDRAFPDVVDQLSDYFAGIRTDFSVTLDLAGTPFQKTVWSALRSIPYGVTWSYGELARCIGKPNAVRAVGAANGQNPVSIIVPCHRVIGATGALTGYGGGLEAKRWLLELESGQGRLA